ncbi:hypothetical protein ASPZODRAFT_18747 [Penicilliopsis zonata CBS 506.65]|uniref:Uncharacterized protein n=1 Tax=Penicilliopsis zonata CBS 506.65 TaxID=1073090 RepID=A0A1L9S9W4_9EURO|nr:hypothetical protein ASPZODRAFT_18747 [Penicilliopsis zonata CBS 506.65]OJJ43970.1 hypothetical protein ASPZODRAFT_18747 [Penicilliopsis zonata CBS 506.65]
MACTLAIFSLLLVPLVQPVHAQSESVAEQNEAGASGSSPGNIGLPTGGMIALCIVVGIVAIIGVASAILFLIAKKQQWAMGETLRYSARRVTEAIKTPLTPRFPRSRRAPPQSQARSFSRPTTKRLSKNRLKDDMELGLKEKAVEVTSEAGSLGAPPKPRGWGTRFSFGR